MKTKEANRLIADFMGYKRDGYWYKDGEDLCYHDEWNWLMPVIQRITKLSRGLSREIQLQWEKLRVNHSNDLWSGDIKSVHKAIVGFIEWYNDREKNKKENQWK